MRSISSDQILERIKNENPWWAEPHQIPKPYSDWTSRPYLKLLEPLVAETEVRRAVVFMGPRRVGKTVLIHHLIGRLLDKKIDAATIGFFSVDHPIYNNMSLEDFVGYFQKITGTNVQTTPCFIFFDEIQYLRDWEKHLKSLVDTYPKVKILVSGSAAAALRLKSTESGAGRFTDFLLPPLTFYEYLYLIDEGEFFEHHENQGILNRGYARTNAPRLNKHFIDYLNFGGYPEAVFSKAIQADTGRFIRSDIIDKVLLRDLPSLYGIEDIQELNYLFSTLAFNTAQEVSIDELSKKSGVSKNTLKKYIEYLEAAFLIRRVQRLDKNARRFRRTHCFKVYLTNPSIKTALFSPANPEDDTFGSLVETAVFSQWFHTQMPLYYARWDRGEVDIVALKQNQKPAWAIEVKWSDRHYEHPEELSAICDFCRIQKIEKVMVTTRNIHESKLWKKINIYFIPASLYCLAVGYHLFSAAAQARDGFQILKATDSFFDFRGLYRADANKP
jgi:uncharacterized protein